MTVGLCHGAGERAGSCHPRLPPSWDRPGPALAASRGAAPLPCGPPAAPFFPFLFRAFLSFPSLSLLSFSFPFFLFLSPFPFSFCFVSSLSFSFPLSLFFPFSFLTFLFSPSHSFPFSSLLCLRYRLFSFFPPFFPFSPFNFFFPFYPIFPFPPFFSFPRGQAQGSWPSRTATGMGTGPGPSRCPLLPGAGP